MSHDLARSAQTLVVSLKTNPLSFGVRLSVGLLLLDRNLSLCRNLAWKGHVNWQKNCVAEPITLCPLGWLLAAPRRLPSRTWQLHIDYVMNSNLGWMICP